MKKKAVLFLLFLGTILCPRAMGQGVEDTATIVFWNVENYFDPFDDEKTADDEFVSGGYKWWSWNRFLTKRNDIAKTIISLKDEFGDYPSIVGLAEVENKMVVNQLVYNTPLAKLNYGVIHHDSPDRRGIDVAMIYRKDKFRILSVENIFVSLPDTTKMTRTILYVKGFSTEIQDTLHLFVNHWPSKWGGAKKSAPNRMAAARTLKVKTDSLLGVNAKGSIVLMGDFNDTPDSESVSLIVSEKLVNTAQELFDQGKGTIRFRGLWEMIDMFIVSSSEGVESKMEIYSPEFLLERDEKYLGDKPFRTYRGPVYLGGFSDHLPIVLRMSASHN